MQHDRGASVTVQPNTACCALVQRQRQPGGTGGRRLPSVLSQISALCAAVLCRRCCYPAAAIATRRAAACRVARVCAHTAAAVHERVLHCDALQMYQLRRFLVEALLQLLLVSIVPAVEGGMQAYGI